MQDAIPLSQRARLSSPATILQSLAHVLPHKDEEAGFCKYDVSHILSMDTRKNLNRLISTKRTEGDTTQQLAPLSLDFPQWLCYQD